MIYKKLDQIELELAETYKRQFLRIHQSYIVNYNFVSRFGHNWVELNTGQCLPMSRKRRYDIENKLGRTQRWRQDGFWSVPGSVQCRIGEEIYGYLLGTQRKRVGMGRMDSVCRVRYCKGMLQIRFKNDCADSGEGRKRISSKPGKYHGIGLLSISRIVRKNKGSMKAGVKDGLFCLEITLYEDLT